MQRITVFVLALTCLGVTARAADVSVPYLGLLTNGRVNAVGTFELSTRVGIDLLFEGGSKFDAWFRLGFRNASMEEYLRAAESISGAHGDALEDIAASVANLEGASALSLLTVAIQIRELLGTPLELATFVGHLDSFCSGSDFTALFGESDFATRFRGYMYYPDGIGGDPSRRYDGLHEVYGTGLRLSLPGERLWPFFYAYQDSWLGAGNYSVDARLLLNDERVKLEAFAGASFPGSAAGIYRGGLLFFFDTGAMGNFYAQIGVPRWDPTEAFRMDLLYFMFEPRVRFAEGELVLSLFFHPAYYLQKETDESGALELRFDLGFGEVSEGKARFGAEAELSYNPNLDSSILTIDAAPYLQTVRNGVRWDLRLSLRAFPFPAQWYGIFMPTVGVSTAF